MTDAMRYGCHLVDGKCRRCGRTEYALREFGCFHAITKPTHSIPAGVEDAMHKYIEDASETQVTNLGLSALAAELDAKAGTSCIDWKTPYNPCEPLKTSEDQVENPKHYMVIPEKDVEAMHIIRAVLGEEGYKNYCHGNMIKYVLRKKGNLTEDLAKAGQYSKMYMGEKL